MRKSLSMRHHRENNITYLSHLKRATMISFLSLCAAVCVFIHGIFPNIFEEIGHSSGGVITIVLPTTKLTATDLAKSEIG